MRRRWLALALLIAAACSTKSDIERLIDREVTGKILLESYSVEMTWGYKLSGMYIDSDAKVWAYERTDRPWYPDKLKPGELSERDMLTKHEGARQIGTVDPVLLRDMAAMIKPAARGKITKPAAIGGEGGALEVAYLFNPGPGTYREIILAGQGDQVASNSASEAQMLVDYLRDVRNLVEPAQGN
jgi:hypothetical protein